MIADAAHGRVLETVGVGRKLDPVPDMSFAIALPKSSDLGDDRLTRTHDSIGHGRHATEPKSDPHRELKRATAIRVSDKLEAALAGGAFDRLVVVAPPSMLGDLRACMARSVLDRVVAEVPKDLAKVADHEIRDHLKEVVAV